jgi:hypothetical protein
MRIYHAVCWLVIGLLAISCSSSTPAHEKPQESITMPPDHSFGSSWEMVPQAISDDTSSTVIIHGMKLSPYHTIVISSIVGDTVDKSGQLNIPAKLRDDIGEADLVSKSNLATLGNISFWAMEFETRHGGASEISLVIDLASSDTAHVRKIAEYVEPPEDPEFVNGRTFLIGAGQSFEQDGYRVTFGWAPPPQWITPTPIELPEGVTIDDKATIQIEDLSTGAISYIFIQFLSNGKITSQLIQ